MTGRLCTTALPTIWPMNKSQNIAILGGTFNPIHCGHLIAAQCVMDTGEFSELWVMPSGNPPHKSNSIIDGYHRLKMCQLAVEGMKDCNVSDFELLRDGKIYSADTFSILREQYPNTRFWLIIGTDSLMNLHRWYKPEVLMEVVNFIIVDRGGSDLSEVQAVIERLSDAYPADFRHVSMPLIELSSTDIRSRVARGLPVRHRLPDSVIHYINNHHLYEDTHGDH